MKEFFSYFFLFTWSHTAVELSVSKQPHKVCPVSRLDVVALQVQRDVSKGIRVAIDVEGADGATHVFTLFLGPGDLTQEVLRKVGGCCRKRKQEKALAVCLFANCLPQGAANRQTRWMRQRA